MREVLKVLQLHNRYKPSSPSGENQVVDNEAAALRRGGHFVEQFERFTEEIEHWGPVKKALLPGRILWSGEAYKDLLAELRRSRPDVVHVHNTFPLLSTSVLYACARARVPLVASVHNYRLICPAGEVFRDGAPCSDCLGRLPWPALRHRCYRGSALATVPMAISTIVNRRTWPDLVSAYICVSESQRDKLRPLGLPEKRVFVKANLILAGSAQPFSSRADMVVYLGRLTAIKGVQVLMSAWDLYRASSAGPRLQLVIGGSGPLEDEVVEWARGRPEVDFLGLLQPEECSRLVGRARAVVVPSQSEETFGLVAVEAMSAGTPVIAAAHGALPELVVDGGSGALFPPADTAALAKVLLDLESEPDRYARYGDQARKQYEARFDPEANLRQLLSIYRFAIEHPAWDTAG